MSGCNFIVMAAPDVEPAWADFYDCPNCGRPFCEHEGKLNEFLKPGTLLAVDPDQLSDSSRLPPWKRP